MSLVKLGRIQNPTPALTLLSLLVLSTGCATHQSGIGQSRAGVNQPDSSSDRIGRHVYAGLGLGRSHLEPDASERPDYTVNDRVEGAGQVTIGMDISRHLTAELHSVDLGSAGFSQGGRINYHVHGGSFLLYAGKNRHNFKRRGLSGYGRLGLGFLQGSAVGDVPFETDNATHILFGAGLEYMTSIGLGMRLEGISYDEDIQYGQLGLVYRTGRRAERKPVEIAKAPVPTPIVAPVPAVVVAKPVVKPAPVDVCSDLNGVLDNVTFHSDSAQLTAQASDVLEHVASRLNECGNVPVQITAHTDSVGAESYNQQLSEQRASSVAQFLSSRGIAQTRLKSNAFGESQPIDTNKTPEGRKRNRRVELLTAQ